MATAEPTIEIIIPNWNGKKLLAECLHSLERQTRLGFSVTVVDNGSRDGSVAYLRSEWPEVKLLLFPENMGFSRAVNEGVRNSEAPWIFLLNNDVEVRHDCIERLYEAIAAYPGYDFFALRMMSYHQRDIFDGAGDAVLRGGVGYRVGTLERDVGQYGEDRDVFGACAGAALYSRRFFNLVGSFDEDFFAYLEDVDLNMRAVKVGLKCRYLADAVIYHVGSATTGSKINPVTVRLSTRNNINVLVKNYPFSILLRFLPAILVYQLMWLALVCKKSSFLAYLRGLVSAVAGLPAMVGKRSDLRQQQTIPNDAFAELLKESEREAIHSIMDRRSSLGKGNGLLKLYLRLFF